LPEKPKIIKLTRRKISKYPRLCPECLSILEQMSPLSGWMTPDYYKCQKCGYSGPIGLENSEKKDESLERLG
tara:strand:- start:447 stop:662 length:216 start_codon:yes stop_codon:yes gene_type:complete